MPFILRRMKPRDVPVVAEIDRLSFPTPWPASAFRRELQSERGAYFVLLKPEDEESRSSPFGKEGWLGRLLSPAAPSRVIGYVGFRLQRQGGHITTIAVHPHWRGRGFGEYLLTVALRKMASQGVGRVTLEMRPSNNLAYRLYRKYGFRVVKFRGGYYRDGEDAWVMAVDISDEDYRRGLRELRRAVKQRLDRQDLEVGQIDGGAL